MKHWPGPYFVAPHEPSDTKLLICNAEIPVAELNLSVPLRPDQTCESARDYDLGTAKFMVDAMNHKPEADQLAELFLELMRVLETREVSDNGTEFSPTTIQSCRCLTVERLVVIMPAMKALAQSIKS